MNIFNHILPNNAILGIGPLLIERNMEQSEALLYNTCRYRFDLHLAAHTTTIHSDWFRPKENEAEQVAMKDWRAEYNRVRDVISEMIGEPTDSRQQHLRHAEDLHAKIQDTLTDLLVDLVPKDDKQIVINARVERILSNVTDLKKLATL